MKLLVVEDEEALATMLKHRFEEAGFVVDTARTLADADWLWSEYPYEAIVLDLGLPGGNGLDLLREKRAAGDDTPVLILTARNRWQERVEGLKAGADDYLGKPFHFEELLARVEAMMRRQAHTGSNRLTVGDLVLDLDSRQLHVGGRAVTLSRNEFRLLTLFMRHPGRIFSREKLLGYLYEQDQERSPSVIDVYIHALRKLVGPERIINLRGQGYYLQAPEDT